jgi:amidophosphoribosyltransferase
VDEIRDFIGADSLAYLSLEGMRLACGERPGQPTTFCTSCYTGKYPTDWVEVHDIKPAAKECAVVSTTP